MGKNDFYIYNTLIVLSVLFLGIAAGSRFHFYLINYELIIYWIGFILVVIVNVCYFKKIKALLTSLK